MDMAGRPDRDDGGYLLEDGRDISNAGKASGVECTTLLNRSKTYDIRVDATAIPAVPVARKKRHFISLLVVVLYSIPLMLSWAVTVSLSIKPFNGSQWDTSYSSPNIGPCAVTDMIVGSRTSCSGLVNLINDEDLAVNERWQRAARLIGSITAVLAVPISSAICARAAVAYLQSQQAGSFRLSKSLALADRGWWDPSIAWKLFHPRRKHLYFSNFLLLATSVCALGAIIWPLQALIVTQEPTRIAVFGNVRMVEPDADVSGLSLINSADIISAARADMESGSPWDSQPNLWKSPEAMCNGSFSSWTDQCLRDSSDPDSSALVYYSPLQGEYNFVSFVINTANTGLFEAHTFRFNSSIQCSNVTEDDFPRPCKGFFTSSITNQTDGSEDSSVEFQVCAPGNLYKFPWNMTRDRQDIDEEVYLHFSAGYVSAISGQTGASSWTQRCSAKTTAGYSMLPNRKNPMPGPLLDEFDLLASSDPRTVMAEENGGDDNPEWTLGDRYPIPNTSETPPLGPLMTATLALFGPSTFFSVRANSTSHKSRSESSTPFNDCRDPVPFHYISQTGAPGRLDWEDRPSCASTDPATYSEDLAQWLYHLFMKPNLFTTQSTFIQSMFYANKAALTRAAEVIRYRRYFMVEPGTEVQLLKISKGGIAVVSVVVGLHVLGLVLLAIYPIKYPTWTSTLDAFEMLKLGTLLNSDQDKRSTVTL